MSEQRRSTRYEVVVSAEVYTKHAVIPATTRNLSNNGVCLDSALELQEEAIVGLSLFLITDGIEDPDAEPLNIKAVVIWSSEKDSGGFSAGLRFDSADEDGQGEIKNFLSQLS